MMLAPEFSRAQTARISDFSTSRAERGVFWMRPCRLGCEPEDEDIGEGPNGLHPLEQYSDVTFTKSRPRTGNTAGRSTPSFALDNRRSSCPPARLPTSRTRPSPEHRLVRGKLIAQFAASNGKTLADACEIINVPPAPTEEDTYGQHVGNPKRLDSFRDNEIQTQRLVDGVDLNCVGVP
jgi:tRNA-dihydrouridine synthase 4